MSDLCESVTERIALSEPLNELRDHVATCSRCERTVAMPSRIAAATERPDPGLGFAARMTIGAQHKLVGRRRQRIAATAGASVAAAAFAVFALTRSTTPEPEPENKPALETKLPAPVADRNDKLEKPVLVDNPELVQLVNLSDTKRASRESARWSRIRKPLRPYIQLVKGVTP